MNLECLIRIRDVPMACMNMHADHSVKSSLKLVACESPCGSDRTRPEMENGNPGLGAGRK